MSVLGNPFRIISEESSSHLYDITTVCFLGLFACGHLILRARDLILRARDLILRARDLILRACDRFLSVHCTRSFPACT